MSETPKPPPTVARINNQGLVEIIDLYTGDVVSVQSSGNSDDYLKNRFENLIKIKTEDGKEVYIERHIDPSRILRNGVASHKFSITWAELIAEQLVIGKTLTAACKHLDLPLPLVNRWRKLSQEFAATIDGAKVQRAETYQDEAVDTARRHEKEEPALLVTTLMKQASLADPDQFNAKTKIEHSGEIAHTFVIETGIRRNLPPPPGLEDAIRNASPLKLGLPPPILAEFEHVSDNEKAAPGTQSAGKNHSPAAFGQMPTEREAGKAPMPRENSLDRRQRELPKESGARSGQSEEGRGGGTGLSSIPDLESSEW